MERWHGDGYIVADPLGMPQLNSDGNPDSNANALVLRCDAQHRYRVLWGHLVYVRFDPDAR